MATTGPVPGAHVPPDVAAAHARLLADHSIQFRLTALEEPALPAWLRPLFELLKLVGPYLVYLFWGVVIIVALIILVLIVREAMGLAWRWPWQRGPALDATDEQSLADAAIARVLLAEAEALAQAGDYDAAVHLLLRRSVEDIVERLPDFVRPSLTARDIAASPTLPARARDAFGTIAVVVEAALFARVPVGAAGWRRARDAYADFALRGEWTHERALA